MQAPAEQWRAVDLLGRGDAVKVPQRYVSRLPVCHYCGVRSVRDFTVTEVGDARVLSVHCADAACVLAASLEAPAVVQASDAALAEGWL